MSHIHKKFTDDQAKDLMRRYLSKAIKRKHVQAVLCIGKSRFFVLLQNYQRNPENFSIQYHRSTKSRIPENLENNILEGLKADKKLLKNPKIPIKSYNYSFLQRRLKEEHNQSVSLFTIINRAKKHGFYLANRPKKAHDREVITNYVGELIQHDSSHHLFAPAAACKWYLITSLDDHSRRILYGDLFEKEYSWTHINASRALITTFGCPFKYYTDSHSIFRFVQGRDSVWRKHHLLTDQVETQWQQVMKDLSIEVTYALSAPAKGKIERPYRWLQDHLVRTCSYKNISDIRKARKILYEELHHYNYHRVHSTTGEVPIVRFERALKENKSLFRPFRVPPPFADPKDIFSFRLQRTINSYRRISIDNLQLKLNNVTRGDIVDLRISPANKSVAELRCWSNNKLIDILRVKISDLKGVHF